MPAWHVALLYFCALNFSLASALSKDGACALIKPALDDFRTNDPLAVVPEMSANMACFDMPSGLKLEYRIKTPEFDLFPDVPFWIEVVVSIEIEPCANPAKITAGVVLDLPGQTNDFIEWLINSELQGEGLSNEFGLSNRSGIDGAIYNGTTNSLALWRSLEAGWYRDTNIALFGIEGAMSFEFRHHVELRSPGGGILDLISSMDFCLVTDVAPFYPTVCGENLPFSAQIGKPPWAMAPTLGVMNFADFCPKDTSWEESFDSANFPWAAVILPSVIVLLIVFCCVKAGCCSPNGELRKACWRACCGEKEDHPKPKAKDQPQSGNAVHPVMDVEDPKGDDTITTAPTEDKPS